MVLYSEQYYKEHYTLQTFEKFGALYMPNLDDIYSNFPGIEPSIPKFPKFT